MTGGWDACLKCLDAVLRNSEGVQCEMCYTKPVEVHARKCGLSLNTYNFPLLKKPGVCETS